MDTRSSIRHLLRDRESLSQYLEGAWVTLGDIKRRLLNLERNDDWHLPDHHYRLLLTKSFHGIHSTGDLFTNGMVNLSEDILNLRSNRISIIPKKNHIWQEMIAAMPPLILQSAFLWQRKKINWSNHLEIKDLLENVLQPNFQHTALPSPSSKSLEAVCKLNDGFHDLHMHLNGTTEADVLWQDYLKFPDKIYTELLLGWKNEKVRELFEQESTQLTPLKFRNLLTVAQKLRTLLFQLTSAEGAFSIGSVEKQLWKINNEFSSYVVESATHPFAQSFRGKYSSLALEALMYMRIMEHLSSNPKDGTAEFFHFYLLVMGLCNRLIVQQTNQYGFEQFQKLTLSGLREYTEAKYKDRFHQIRGNELKHISFLEGRFSPKSTEKELTEMVNLVLNGWTTMHSSDLLKGITTPELKLVAHFIKKAEGKSIDVTVRYKALRVDLWNRALVLSLLCRKYPMFKKLITGIDAASSEFDAPPEVFAPVYRFLKRDFNHFTYHAGEDFHHLLSGLRAIYEAIIFTDMQNGDRIGHAVAAGLSPTQWVNAVGKEILISRGEWLDNLIFIYHLCKSPAGIQLKYLQPVLIANIELHSKIVYRKKYDLKYLEKAWLHRKYEPMLILSNTHDEAKYSSVYDKHQWSEIQKLKIDKLTTELIQRYNSKIYRSYYEEIIPIKSDEILNVFDMTSCQHMLLGMMSIKKIIIEALPTSNIRIGHHRNFDTYHLWNWLKWKKEGKKIPPIVLGTDDTGIFATNIFNEYANVYIHLEGSVDPVMPKAKTVINNLVKNSKRYRF